MDSRPERVNGHTGTETRPRLLREAAAKNLPMGESLTERRRVNEEGLTVVKFFSWGRIRNGVESHSDDIIQGISPGQLRASSRGNT